MQGQVAVLVGGARAHDQLRRPTNAGEHCIASHECRKPLGGKLGDACTKVSPLLIVISNWQTKPSQAKPSQYLSCEIENSASIGMNKNMPLEAPPASGVRRCVGYLRLAFWQSCGTANVAKRGHLLSFRAV